MPKAQPLYTKKEYTGLIRAAVCISDLEFIEELLQEDRTNRAHDPFDYIDIRCAMTLKLTQLTIDGAEDMLRQ